ncbi:MAG: FadR/GntR family transcriptional regulator [Clostridiaceae bacterium]
MKEIKRISITDAIVENIREMIESGEFKIGEKLPAESKLCEDLKVSRTSLREAFRVLQTLSYITILPGKGAYVADPKQSASHNKKDWYEIEDAKFYDFMDVRIAIETLSVRLSVERATTKQVGELQKIHESFVAAGEEQDGVRLIMLDELFHNKITEYTGNQLLVNINKQLTECFRIYRGSSFMNKDVYRNALEPHARILECFLTRDAVRAVTEMREHLDITAQDMSIIHSPADTSGVDSTHEVLA